MSLSFSRNVDTSDELLAISVTLDALKQALAPTAGVEITSRTPFRYAMVPVGTLGRSMTTGNCLEAGKDMVVVSSAVSHRGWTISPLKSCIISPISF
jgi:hypothetical protein